MQLVKFISLSLVIFIGGARAEVIGNLPEPITNNAVAAAMTKNGWQLYSFNGLKRGKDWRAVSNSVYRFDLKSQQSYPIKTVPYQTGRLASIAVTVKNKIYLFGGYTVAENHEEKSIPSVHRFDPQTNEFQKITEMSIPVDDTVALVYQDRFIYLVSGWHDVGNVTDVQVFDTKSGRWFFATPYPGKSVFGHAGGIVGNQMVIADGVFVSGVRDLKRQFAMSDESYIGIINPNDFTQINWQKLPSHPGPARYRMAAVGDPTNEQVIFVGGSVNPYNFNGIGYNGEASGPSKHAFAFDLKTKQWQQKPDSPIATMDHRGLLMLDGAFFILGGMLDNQKVTDNILKVF
ncbi:galactose oxidase [Aliikangiella marina]|uniref:Galactose oxidase n=1 Tax=Aliikangiella marina TaxID=1712262 RepID=A0A545TIC0_9GAMM|nr:kelch repeat-containing protein [Aliikangiella marina]TQV76970.1 galactose oxidase [Aliikangiella marina]